MSNKPRSHFASNAEYRRYVYQREKSKEVYCSHCGREGKNQREGDGCHACQRGTMQRVTVR